MQKLSKLLILFPFFLVSCKEAPETQDEYIQRALKERISVHTQKEKEKCVTDINSKAIEIADSILLKEALALDSLQDKLPVVPPKPEFIEPEPIGDSLPVQPFLEQVKSQADSID